MRILNARSHVILLHDRDKTLDKLIKELQVNCENCSLDTICLPRGLSRSEIEGLNSVVKNDAVLQRGDYIYRQGDAFKGIIAIKSGAAKLVTIDSQGTEHILNVLLPGELIGFDGLNENKHNCSAMALDVMSYCELPADQFDSLCQQIPGIARELFKHSTETISASQSQIVASKRSAEEKLAMFIISLSDRLMYRGFSPLAFNIPLTRQELGDHLGLTVETVSRMLQQLQNNELISVNRKNVEIKDLKGLRKIYS